MDKAELNYPHIEIDLSQGSVRISLAENSDSHIVLNQSDEGHLQELLEQGNNLVPGITAEMEDESSNKIEFELDTNTVDLELSHLAEQLVQKLEKQDIFGLSETKPGEELYNYLIASWKADLLYNFHRAIMYQILATTLEITRKQNKAIDSFVLKPGNVSNTAVEWFLRDFETLGYELQVVFD